MNHALAKRARRIDWGFLEEKFGEVYKDGAGQPPLPTRLMAGLAILKHTYNLSDEAGWEEGGGRHSQTHLQPQRRGGVREVGREPLLPILLRRGVFPAPAAARSFLDDPLAQSHGRRTAAGAVAGESGGCHQDRRDEAIRPLSHHCRYHGAAEERYVPDRRQAVEPG